MPIFAIHPFAVCKGERPNLAAHENPHRASGFVGSFLVEHGLELGHEVWAALRATSSRRYLTDPRIRFIELQLGDDATLRRQLGPRCRARRVRLRDPRAAGATKAADFEAFRRTNTAGTLRLPAPCAN